MVTSHHWGFNFWQPARGVLFFSSLYSVVHPFGRDFIHPIVCAMLQHGTKKFSGRWIWTSSSSTVRCSTICAISLQFYAVSLTKGIYSSNIRFKQSLKIEANFPLPELWFNTVIYSRLSRSFTARGFSSRDSTKGIRLISFKSH